MELEELKAIWKEEAEKDISAYKVSLDEVRGGLTRKSQATIATIKKAIRFKIVMSAIIGTLCLAIVIADLFGFLGSDKAFAFNSYLSPIEEGIMYLILATALFTISIFNTFSHVRITDFERSSLPIKETIDHVIKIIKSIMNLGRYSDLLVSPFIFAFTAYVIVYRREGSDLEYPWLIIIGVYLVGFAFSYFMNKWGMKRRFGNDLDQLKKYQKELEI